MTEGTGCDIIFKETSARGKERKIHDLRNSRSADTNKKPLFFHDGILQGVSRGGSGTAARSVGGCLRTSLFRRKRNLVPPIPTDILKISVSTAISACACRGWSAFCCTAAVLDYKGEGYAFLGLQRRGKIDAYGALAECIAQRRKSSTGTSDRRLHGEAAFMPTARPGWARKGAGKRAGRL